jgi:hypothetical protein
MFLCGGPSTTSLTSWAIAVRIEASASSAGASFRVDASRYKLQLDVCERQGFEGHSELIDLEWMALRLAGERLVGLTNGSVGLLDERRLVDRPACDSWRHRSGRISRMREA